jgi:hypothetical protein
MSKDDKTHSTSAALATIARTARSLPELKSGQERTDASITILSAAAELAGHALDAHQALTIETSAHVQTLQKLAETNAPESPSGSEANERMTAMGDFLAEAMAYTKNRIRQLPTLTGDTAEACASIVRGAAQAWGHMSWLQENTRMNSPVFEEMSALAQDAQAAYDGWRAKQPATGEPE